MPRNATKKRVFYVYVLRSEIDSGLYIGYSSDLKRRFAQHEKGVAMATSYRGPWKLIYYEAYVEQADALGREKFLKSGSGRSFLKRQLKHYLAKHPFSTAKAQPPNATRLYAGLGVKGPLD